MNTLTNIFTREKTLFYFAMWNDSDRMGYKNFLDYEVKNNLFIIPPVGEKGSVWYSNEDLEQIDALLTLKVNSQDFQSQIFETLEQKWKELKIYLEDGKSIENGHEFLTYYQSLIEWWSAMNTVFTVPEDRKSTRLNSSH